CRRSGRGPAADEVTTSSSAGRHPVSAITKVTGADHPVSPCCWLRSRALRRVQLDPDREGLVSPKGDVAGRSGIDGERLSVATACSQVLVDYCGCDTVPAVAEKERQTAGAGEKEVHAVAWRDFELRTNSAA